jgi:hypothetical protein
MVALEPTKVSVDLFVIISRNYYWVVEIHPVNVGLTSQNADACMRSSRSVKVTQALHTLGSTWQTSQMLK